MLAVAGVLVLGAGVGLGIWGFRPGVPEPAAVPISAVPAQDASAEPAVVPAPGTPAFDVVLVSPDGGAVIAGRAEPGAVVTVLENGRVVGTANADRHGSWVISPDTKLPPGAGELTLTANGAAGKRDADAPVLVVVPAPPSAIAAASEPVPALAVLAPAAGPSRVLQAPGPPVSGRKLGVGTVDYDEHGAIQFSGTAPSEAAVRIYVDNAPVGDTKAGDGGQWSMSPPAQVRPGIHTLRLDQVGTDGHVLSRVELPFQRETLAHAQVAPGQVVVQPGENLWRLARNVYGAGIRYTVIYRANRTQIRDPRHIYPGQVFNTPGASQPAVVTQAVAH